MTAARGFEAGHRGLGGANPGRHFRLAEAGLGAGLQNLIEKREFIGQPIIFAANPGMCQPRLLNALRLFRIFHLLHPFARDIQFLPGRFLRLIELQPSSDDKSFSMLSGASPGA